MNKNILNFLIVLMIFLIGILVISEDELKGSKLERIIVKKMGVKKIDSIYNTNLFFKIICLAVFFMGIFLYALSSILSEVSVIYIFFSIIVLGTTTIFALMIISDEINSPYSDYNLEIIKPRTFISSTKLYCLEQMNINTDLEKLKDLEIDKLREVVFEIDTNLLINRSTEFNGNEKNQLLKEYDREKRELYYKMLEEKERERLKKYSENNLKNWA